MRAKEIIVFGPPGSFDCDLEDLVNYVKLSAYIYNFLCINVFIIFDSALKFDQ